MKAEFVDIQEMVLRVPGLSEEEARMLGQEVAERVADGLSPEGSRKELGVLDLRVGIPQGTPRQRLGMAIAEAIIKGLG